ncbi:MAG: hypothetical protein Q8P34_08335 [Bacteroidota bacterium]|nr:hypothetical protein [Bacteroidota bacterium]
MKKLVSRMQKFAERNFIDGGVTLSLEDDETGYLESFESQKIIFQFNSMKELKTKLAKTYEPQMVFESLHEN